MVRQLGYLIFLLFAIVLITVWSAEAAYLVCSPAATVTRYKVVIAGQTVEVPAQTDGSVKFDISPYSGTNITGTICAGREWLLNGVPSGVWEWGTNAPFVLNGGAVSAAPAGIGLVK